ncbi:tryptamine:oxygen oxidoreductase (deaminating) [Balamuthia mandrillaris]
MISLTAKVWLLGALLVVALTACSATTEIHFNFGGMIPASTCCEPSECQEPAVCPLGGDLFEEPEERGVFDPLTAEEMLVIDEFVHQQEELNLTRFNPDLKFSDNYVWRVEWLAPPKAQALAYLNGESDTPPARYAMVTVYRGGRQVPDVMEYKVGPLPEPTTIEPLREDNEIPFSMRVVDNFEYAYWEVLIEEAFVTLENLTRESYNLTYVDCEEGYCINWSDNSPRGYFRDDRETWVWAMKLREGWYLEHLGLEFQVDHFGSEPSLWFLKNFVYFGQGPFATAQELMDAYNSGTITKYTMEENRLSGEPRFSSMRRRGEELPGMEKQGPIHVQPEGDRWTMTGRRVDYMGWSFHISYSHSFGMQLFDIRYNGEPIAYEISLNEAYVAYSGWGGVNTNTIYTDSGWGLGVSPTPLAPGVDCPDYAVFIDQEYWYMGDPETAPGPDVAPRAVCIFESDPAIGVYRHYETVGVDNFYSGARHHVLVVRTSSSVYNYDYLFDYKFGLDGGIEVAAASSGYIQASNWIQETQNPPERQESGEEAMEYGHRIHEYTWGVLHDHFASYKVDLDVAGTQNSFENQVVKTRAVERAWSTTPAPVILKYLEKNVAETEVGVKLDASKPAHWVFVSEEENQWGEKRGYRVHLPGSIHQLLPDEHPYLKSAAWSKYNLAVTKYKEEESACTHIMDMQAPAEPLVNLDNFIDGESIINEDLVAWVSFGSIHVPTSEDIPNTNTPSSFGHFWLRPHNFFTESPSIAARGNVFVNLNDRENPTVEEYTLGNNGNCQVPAFEFEYLGATVSA